MWNFTLHSNNYIQWRVAWGFTSHDNTLNEGRFSPCVRLRVVVKTVSIVTPLLTSRWTVSSWTCGRVKTCGCHLLECFDSCPSQCTNRYSRAFWLSRALCVAEIWLRSCHWWPLWHDWLGELSLTELAHKLKTTPHAVAIGRLRQKYGSRFLQEHMEAGTAALKPDEPFIAPRLTIFLVCILCLLGHNVLLCRNVCLSGVGWRMFCKPLEVELRAQLGKLAHPSHPYLRFCLGRTVMLPSRCSKRWMPQIHPTLCWLVFFRMHQVAQIHGLKEWTPGEGIPTHQVLPHVQQTKMQQLEDRHVFTSRWLKRCAKGVAESTAHVETGNRHAHGPCWPRWF